MPMHIMDARPKRNAIANQAKVGMGQGGWGAMQ